MRRGPAITAGALAGLALGGLVFALASRAGGTPHVPCPSGFRSIAAPTLAGATGVVACAEGDGPRAAVLAVYRTARPAVDASDQSAVDVGRATGAIPRDARPDAPERESAEGGALAVVSRGVDAGEVPLLVDVYFLAAGRRFGLLSVAHAPDAPFAEPHATAAWMDTIQGVSPWGTENAGPLAARCPEGFTAMPTAGERVVVRCVYGAGSSRFATLSLSWDEGGFAREEDRTTAANAIAARVARSQGGAARVVSAPVPFTLARRVDALHTRVETGERVPVTVRAVAAHAPGGAPDALAIAVSQPDLPAVPLLRAMLASGGYLAKPSPLSKPLVAAAVALVLAALGALAGSRVGRERAGDEAT